MSGLNPPQGSTPIPVTARLSSPEQDIRFMKCIFPRNTFSQMATLSEFIVNYDHGPFEDTSVVSNSVPLFVDVHPGACPNVVMVNGDDNMLIAVLGSSRVSSGGIDVQTVGLNNRTVHRPPPLRIWQRHLSAPGPLLSIHCLPDSQVKSSILNITFGRNMSQIKRL
jgi:hypothetical protein